MVYVGIQGIIDSGGAVLQRFLLPASATFGGYQAQAVFDKVRTGVLSDAWYYTVVVPQSASKLLPSQNTCRDVNLMQCG